MGTGACSVPPTSAPSAGRSWTRSSAAPPPTPGAPMARQPTIALDLRASPGRRAAAHRGPLGRGEQGGCLHACQLRGPIGAVTWSRNRVRRRLRQPGGLPRAPGRVEQAGKGPPASRVHLRRRARRGSVLVAHHPENALRPPRVVLPRAARSRVGRYLEVNLATPFEVVGERADYVLFDGTIVRPRLHAAEPRVPQSFRSSPPRRFSASAVSPRETLDTAVPSCRLALSGPGVLDRPSSR